MSKIKSEKSSSQRTTALCYVRQSFTRDADDTNSPDRQKANIQAMCERNGWTPEWYEDVGGHKSGRYEKNRPQWLALKARLGDPDVIALVANDLSRLHRKGWRVGDLIEYLNEYNVNLVLAAPGREVDTTTMKGRMFLQFGAIVDEYYAEDISQRAKDNVAYRKGQGKSIGMTPFGSVRGAEGYLQPSSEGAWLLPSGTFVVGEAAVVPEDGAVWRGYYDAAHYILRLYATNQYGLEKIAYRLNDEGWAFRDRTGTPRIVTRDDIRRVVANWPEYGGLTMDKSGKDRPAYEKYDIDSILFKEERAVFPLALVKAVAQVRQERTIEPIDQGVNRVSHFYPLSGITYCACCERLSIQHNDPKLRTALGGTDTYGTLRYKHKTGVKCGCNNRSVRCEIYEHDFNRLIKLLTVRPEKVNLMRELAIQADQAHAVHHQDFDPEKEKQEAITLCRRRIEAAVVLFGDGMIDRDEYRRRIEANEREIAHWEARTSETEKLALELAMCIEVVDKISRLWDISTEEDRQGLVHSLFAYLVYDLDTQRIVDFRLKPWVDHFLILREALYNDENGTGGSSSSANDIQTTTVNNEVASAVDAPMGHN